MSTMNKVILLGRMGEDPKLSYTISGTAVASFSLATDEGYKDRQTGNKVDKVEWHSIVLWRGLAEFAQNYLSKGRLVLVEGKLQKRKWQAQDGTNRYKTEVVGVNIQALDKSPQQGQQQNHQQGGYQQPQQNNNPPDEDLGPSFPSEENGLDDVPF